MPLSYRPDAIRWPMGPGAKPVDREHRSAIDSRVEFAEHHLQSSPIEMVHVRDVVLMGYHFATRDPADLEFEPQTRKPRYRWEDQGSGVKYGYLLEPECPAS